MFDRVEEGKESTGLEKGGVLAEFSCRVEEDRTGGTMIGRFLEGE